MIGPSVPPDATPAEHAAAQFIRGYCLARGLRFGTDIQGYMLDLLAAYIEAEAKHA